MFDRIVSSRNKIGMAGCGIAAVAIPVLDTASDAMQSTITTWMPVLITFMMLGMMVRMMGGLTGK